MQGDNYSSYAERQINGSLFASQSRRPRLHNWMENMIRVLIADDHRLVRQGIRALLEDADDIEVVGEAENGQEALKLVERLKPDVLVMDVSMPELDGIQATEKIQALNVPTQIVILSMYANTNLVKQALRKGARGYVLKRAATEELLTAVHIARQGRVFLSPAVADSVSA